LINDNLNQGYMLCDIKSKSNNLKSHKSLENNNPQTFKNNIINRSHTNTSKNILG